MKQRIFFLNETIFNLYVFSLSDKHSFKFNWWVYDSDSLYLRKKALISDNLDLILLSTANISYDDIVVFDKLLKPNDILIADLYSYLMDGNNDEFNEYINTHKLKFNCVFIDCNGESVDSYFYNNENIIKLLNTDDTIFIISNRTIDIFHKRLSHSNFIINILYYFHLFSDNINIHPEIKTPNGIIPTYDFITYIGLGTGDAADDRIWRNQIIESIDFNNKTINTPRSFDEIRNIQNQYRFVYDWPTASFGSYSLFSLMESLDSKIKIVFETERPDTDNLGQIYFTEKTTKCLISDQPYILFIHEKLRNELIKYGFKFVEPNSIQDITKYVSEICKGDIDIWINKNKLIYEENKKLFKNLVYSTEVAHISRLYDWKLL